MVGGHQAIDFGRLRDVIFFVHDSPPAELGQDAIVHAIPPVVLDVQVVGRNELADARTEDDPDGRDDGFLGLALIAERDDHRALGRQMTFVNRADDVFLDADETEVHRSVGVLHRVVPLIGPGHGDGHRIVGFDLDVHVATTGGRTVHAAGMDACGLHGDGLVVRGSPIEDTIVLTECDCRAGAEQYGECTELSHYHQYWRGTGRDLSNSQWHGYGGT